MELRLGNEFRPFPLIPPFGCGGPLAPKPAATTTGPAFGRRPLVLLAATLCPRRAYRDERS